MVRPSTGNLLMFLLVAAGLSLGGTAPCLGSHIGFQLVAERLPGVGAAPGGMYANDSAGEPIVPIPQAVDVNRERAALGERLFHDTRLSDDGSLACVSCHDLARGGDDGLALPRTINGQPGVVNTPTIFNSSLSFRLGWRGNYRKLEDQIDADIRDSRLLNTSWSEILARLRADPSLRKAFGRVYEDGITRENVLDALGAFHESLVTPNARFDQYLRGREDALSADEKRGYQLFRNLGCASCHQGVNVGGNLFQKVGIFKDYFAHRGNLREVDFGRFLDTGAERDLFVFRVPSLRNVAATAPYFHDGSVRSLGDAVRKMAEIQLDEALSDEEVDLIVQFLATLSGEYRGERIVAE